VGKRELLIFLRKLLLGANIGAHNLIMAKLVGSKGHIYAFEPTEYAVKKLQTNVNLNPNLQNITITKEIVTNSTKKLPKLKFKSSWNINGDDKEKHQDIKDPKANSIDEFVKNKNLARLDLLKIDVDGYDYKVLEGSMSSIIKFKPKIFCELCEYALNEQGDSIKDIYKLLSDLNYKGYFEDGKKIDDVKSIFKIVGLNTSKNSIFF